MTPEEILAWRLFAVVMIWLAVFASAGAVATFSNIKRRERERKRRA